MTGKQFMNSVANGKSDLIQTFLDILAETKSPYCFIGGLAVNAFVEPVISLDVDLAAAMDNMNAISRAASKRGLRVERFERGVRLTVDTSDLRIQLQTDPRYQEFIGRAEDRNVLGYKMRVAALEDVLKGKVWAYLDSERRRSKRQKDLADILRIIEAFPEMENTLPAELRSKLSER